MRFAVVAILGAGCGRIAFVEHPSRDGGLAGPDGPPPCSVLGFISAPLPVTGAAPRAIALADLDGDGNLDLVITNGDDGTVSVYRGNGDGTFQPRMTQPTDVHPWSVAIGDLGTGAPSIVVGNYGPSFASVYHVTGGMLSTKQDFTTGLSPQAVEIGDIDGDHVADIVAADHDADAITVLLNDGNATFMPKTDLGTGTGSKPYAVEIADLNNDGKPDLAVADTNTSSVSVLLGTGGGAFQPAVMYPAAPAGQPWSIAVADVDHDGKPDLAVANNYGDNPANITISVLLGNGDGTFKPEVDYPSNPNPWWVAFADLDGDGNQDLVVANGQGNTMSVFLGVGDGTFQPHRDFPTGAFVTSLAIGDVNNDGRPDVLLPNQTDGTVSVLITTCIE